MFQNTNSQSDEDFEDEDELNNSLHIQQEKEDKVQIPIIEEIKEQPKKKTLNKMYFIPNKDGSLEQIDFGFTIKKKPPQPVKDFPKEPPQVIKVKTPEKIIEKPPTPELVQISDEILWGYNKFNLLKHLKKLQNKHNKQEPQTTQKQTKNETNQNTERNNRFLQYDAIIPSVSSQTLIRSNSPHLPQINTKQIAWKPGKAVPMPFQQINKSLSPFKKLNPNINFNSNLNTERSLFSSNNRSFQKIEYSPRKELISELPELRTNWKYTVQNQSFIQQQQNFPQPKIINYKKFDRNIDKIENNLKTIQNYF